METPIVAINMKTYPQSCGFGGQKLAELCEDVAIATGKSIAIAPQQIDLALFVDLFEVPIFAQHVDNVKQGSSTGRITPEASREIGCSGTLINPSE